MCTESSSQPTAPLTDISPEPTSANNLAKEIDRMQHSASGLHPGLTTNFTSISVVVPVYNRVHLIGPCLEHLQKAAITVLKLGIDVEIIVADDASTDGTPDKVKTVAARCPEVPIELVGHATRQGPARTRNAALSVARGELVVFVDSDVIVVEDLLLAHLTAYSGSAMAYTVGRVVAVPDLEKALEYPEPTAWDLSRASLDTANSSVPRKHLAAVGFFDSGFAAYGWEDLDLGRRLKKYGLTRLTAPRAVGYHVVPPIRTREQLRARLQKERERGQTAVHFMHKHPEFSARMTAQDTPLHRGLNWIFRLGGFVREDNVLNWVEWARKHRLTAFERMWMAGVLNQVYLESLTAAKRARTAQEP